MTDSEKIFEILESEYPDAQCELDFGDTFQLLVAVILSAQCTDKRVNIVSKELFKRASTPQDFVDIPLEELEKLIYSCGFYRNKAKNIKAAAKEIVENYGGRVPDTFDGLLSLAGVGRKTANVVFDVGYGGDGIPVDTHVFRTSNRLALADGKTPTEVEKGLLKIIPEGKRNRAHHLLIFHGRYKCKSQSPDCGSCKLTKFCNYYKQHHSEVTK